jgi:hypothetical protein
VRVLKKERKKKTTTTTNKVFLGHSVYQVFTYKLQMLSDLVYAINDFYFVKFIDA